MRTRYGKQQKLKDGDGSKDLTSRDQWIINHFAFIGHHIYTCPNRRTGIVSIELIINDIHYTPTLYMKLLIDEYLVFAGCIL